MIVLTSLAATEQDRTPGDALCGLSFVGPYTFREPMYTAHVRLEGLTGPEVDALHALVGERLSVSRAKGGGV